MTWQRIFGVDVITCPPSGERTPLQAGGTPLRGPSGGEVRSSEVEIKKSGWCQKIIFLKTPDPALATVAR